MKGQTGSAIFHITHSALKFPVRENDPISLKNYISSIEFKGDISEDFVNLVPFF